MSNVEETHIWWQWKTMKYFVHPGMWRTGSTCTCWARRWRTSSSPLPTPTSSSTTSRTVIRSDFIKTFVFVSHGIWHFFFWLVKTNLKEFTGKGLLWNLICAVWVFYFEIFRLAEASDTWYHQFDMTFWSEQIYVMTKWFSWKTVFKTILNVRFT